jgi:hypothetical protein
MRASFILAAVLASSLVVAQNDTKGQQQLVGGTGQFGTTYSLKNGLNFAILAGRYSVAPYNSYGALSVDNDHKLVVLDLAIKNATPQDQFFNPDSMFTLVDDKDQVYPDSGSLMLESQGNKDFSATLRPGQGLGQPALKDPLHIAFIVPAKARINKIMLNVGRLNTNEQVVRYLLVAPPAKPSAPDAPKNFLAPLPDYMRDPADSWGATALEEGKGAPNVFLPTGAYEVRFDGLTSTTDAIFNGAAPDDGKTYVVMAITARHPMTGEIGLFDLEGGDAPQWQIKDADGEVYKPIGYRKSKADEDPDHTFHLNDEYSFRVVFALPRSAKPKTLTIGAGNGHRYTLAAG